MAKTPATAQWSESNAVAVPVKLAFFVLSGNTLLLSETGPAAANLTRSLSNTLVLTEGGAQDARLLVANAAVTIWEV